MSQWRLDTWAGDTTTTVCLAEHQKDTEQTQSAMATLDGQQGMKVETVRPRITGKGNVKLMEKKLETSQRKENVTTQSPSDNNVGDKVVVEGSAMTLTNFSTMQDATCLPIIELGSDVAELSSMRERRGEKQRGGDIANSNRDNAT